MRIRTPSNNYSSTNARKLYTVPAPDTKYMSVLNDARLYKSGKCERRF